MIVNRLNDVLFEYIFFRPERKHLLLALVNAVLDDGSETDALADIEVTPRDLPPETRPFELFRHFMAGKRPDGTLVDIELQISGFPFNPREVIRRSLFCWSQNYASQPPGPGRTFKELRPSVVITLMREKVFNDEAYHHRFRIAESLTGEPLTGDLQMHFIELVKWKNLPKHPETRLECWLDYFTNKAPYF